MNVRIYVGLVVLILAAQSCSQSTSSPEPVKKPTEVRIATLNPTATEFLFALGLGELVVLRDVTSVHPPEALHVSPAGSSHTFSLEGLLAGNPTHVVAAEGKLDPTIQDGLRKAGVDVFMVPAPQSVEQGKNALEAIASHFGVAAKSNALSARYACEAQDNPRAPRALFVYARSGGNLMAAGNNTGVGSMMVMAGAQNVAGELDGFKPLSTEALVGYDPEVVILFDHGFEAIGGADGLMAVPGMDQTSAGKTQAFVHMPAHALNGFGLDVCQTLATLTKTLSELP